MLSLSECIPWMTVGLAESVAIVTLNLCTIIVFIKRRNLRKRSMYLVINLAVIDMFVGGVVVYDLFFRPGVDCNLWKWPSIEEGIFSFISVILDLSNLRFNNKHRHHCFRTGTRDVLPVEASSAKKMGTSINNCRCLGYIWVSFSIFSTFDS